MVSALKHLRRMRGGAQSQLLFASDSAYYVVKFRNNPQGSRILANELVATLLAKQVGLPVAEAELIDVSAELIASRAELRIELGSRTEPCESGIQYGSRYVLTPGEGEVFDIMPQSVLNRVANLGTFAGMFVFDKWACNKDGRQAVFWKTGKQHKYTATFIDHGWCFAAARWILYDGPRFGLYRDHTVYTGVTGWDSFEPWLSRIETLSDDVMYECAEAVPAEWYGKWSEMQWLVEQLLLRRRMLRYLIKDTLHSDPRREVFPNWRCNDHGHRAAKSA